MQGPKRSESDDLAAEAGDEIYKHLKALSLIFADGCELTLVVRHPDAPGEMDAVFTTESDLRHAEHVLMVRRRMPRQEVGRVRH